MPRYYRACYTYKHAWEIEYSIFQMGEAFLHLVLVYYRNSCIIEIENNYFSSVMLNNVLIMLIMNYDQELINAQNNKKWK